MLRFVLVAVIAIASPRLNEVTLCYMMFYSILYFYIPDYVMLNILHNIILCVSCHIEMYYHYILLYFIVLRSMTLQYIRLHDIIVYYSVFRCLALSYIVSSPRYLSLSYFLLI